MLFVSRELRLDSPLRRWAAARGEEVIAQSLLTFAPVGFTAPTQVDWWFYYSSRAVEFAGAPPENVRLAAIGGSTAAVVLRRTGRVDFCGNGHPEKTAEDFLSVGEGQRVFFPRARQSRLSVQTALVERVEVVDTICYDNRPAPPAGAILADTYIFTSPLNVAAYLDHWPLLVGARVLAIGPSTGKELLRRGVACVWPGEPSEAGLVSLLLESGAPSDR